MGSDVVERLRAFEGSDALGNGDFSLMEEAASTIAGLEAQVEQTRKAWHGVLVGGNHLALLIGADHPSYETDPLAALEHYGAGNQYEVWCAWRSIMIAREALGEE